MLPRLWLPYTELNQQERRGLEAVIWPLRGWTRNDGRVLLLATQMTYRGHMRTTLDYHTRHDPKYVYYSIEHLGYDVDAAHLINLTVSEFLIAYSHGSKSYFNTGAEWRRPHMTETLVREGNNHVP